MNHQVWLSLGSNLGDRLEYLRMALARLKDNPHIRVEKRSSVYQTEPWGVSGQGDYYNAAIEISTDLTPLELLDYTRSIEDESGRRRRERWSPRELDIDILVFDRLWLQSEALTIPHPRLGARMFVLVPLQEIAGDIQIPGFGRLQAILTACDQNQKVEKIYAAEQWEEGVGNGDRQ